MQEHPKRRHTGLVCRNLDSFIDDHIAQRLQEEHVWADYTAWNFHGCVWYEEGRFSVEIRQYGAHVATLSAPSIASLMQLACEQYGAE